jgi:hypothetical protein
MVVRIAAPVLTLSSLDEDFVEQQEAEMLLGVVKAKVHPL